MHSKNNNIEFMPYDNANEVVHKLFELLLSRYSMGLETSTKGIDFIYDSVQLLYCKCRGGSYYSDSPD